MCAIVVPGHQHPDGEDDDHHWFGDSWSDVAGDECHQCGTGHLLPYAQHGQIPTWPTGSPTSVPG
ncbi:hypothetical protein [Actinoplanes regularis]|uniref:Uncharacterized protein n=1 Tax=Actinoplanes regularis TaxID=52697 RepID=A0A239J669_9ACTN|nr:hypothetical protein [Actinoplanes regularis]GIE89704.1 hypothetical protein Are01nite_61840 [Actinoplanes regularis]SNT00753.1 hypothetical protein SAMN06264365_13265 [Actinoplanes regularis]